MQKKKNLIVPHFIFLVLAILLYGNTLKYDYTLDDLMVIKQNSFTSKGIKGIADIFSYDSFTGFFGKEKKLVSGGRYRPLSLATFAIEYQTMGGFSPALSHLINILLYAVTGMLLFLLLNKLVPPEDDKHWLFSFSFLVVILFMLHPVHTEVVANIKGRDEILAFLLSVAAALFAIRFTRNNSEVTLLVTNLFLFLALLSKENAISFVVIIPLIIIFFIRTPRRLIVVLTGSLIITAGVFILVRFMVLGYLNSGDLPKELLNNPFLGADLSQKVGTILATLGLYLKLLIFPVTLTHDYYPYHIQLVEISDPRAMLSLIIYLSLLAIPFLWRKEKVINLAVWIYMIPLFIVSNILFPVGTFMNERFIYFSSFGFILGVLYIIWYKIPGILKLKKLYYRPVFLVLVLVAVLFAAKTIGRNRVWKDNFTLFTTDVVTSENSIKCNIAAGGEWMKEAELQKDSVKIKEYYFKSMSYLEKALSIYPKATNGLVLYGNALAKFRKDYKGAIRYYSRVLEYEPYEPNAFKNIRIVLNALDNKKECDYKIMILKQLNAIFPDNIDVCHSLGKMYGQYKGQLDSSRFYLEEGYKIEPNDPIICKDLGVVCGLLGDYAMSLKYLSKASQLNPSDISIQQNIKITKQLIGKKK
jgi:Flp pilus assembly protein TadD